MIAVAGEDLPGFNIRAGIRPGCLLSPPFFAVCGDILLRRLRHELPQGLLRAYADDLVLVAADVSTSAPACSRIFAEFAAACGL